MSSPIAPDSHVWPRRLFGPEDLSASVYGMDLVVSKELVSRGLWDLSPYAGLSGYLARGQEHTSKVELEDENVLGAQGTLGVALGISVVRLGVEYSVGKVDGYAFKLAFGS